MKNSISKVSILMLSIYFFIGSTEILKASFAEKGNVFKARDGRKNAHDVGGTPKTPSGRPPVPEGALFEAVHESMSLSEHGSTSNTGNIAAEGRVSNQPIDLNEPRPSTSNEFTQNQTPTKLVFKIEKPSDANNASKNSMMKSISDIPAAVYESFKKALDFITRKIQQDRTLTSEERHQLKAQCEAAKQSLQ